MKKFIIVLSALVVASMAQAAAVWNILWFLGGGWAYSPDHDGLDVLNETDNYELTWSLINADTGLALPGATMTGTYSSLPSFTDPAGTSSYRTDLTLASGSDGIYYGTDAVLDTKINVYQYIYISNGTTAYEWKGTTYEVPAADTTKTPMDTPTKLFNGEIIIGKQGAADPDVNAFWTPVAVPGPAGVPEPATISLLGIGALAMVLRRKLRK